MTLEEHRAQMELMRDEMIAMLRKREQIVQVLRRYIDEHQLPLVIVQGEAITITDAE